MCFMRLPEIRKIPFFLSFSFFPCLSQSFSPFAGPDGVYEQQPSSGEWCQPRRSQVGVYLGAGGLSFGGVQRSSFALAWMGDKYLYTCPSHWEELI